MAAPRHDPELLRRAIARLFIVSKLQVAEAWLVSIVAIVIGSVVVGDVTITTISAVVTTIIAFGADTRLRRGASAMLGDDPSGRGPTVIARALEEAALPIGLDPKRIFPRHLRSRSAKGPFAAGVINTAAGDVVLIGDVIVERSIIAADRNRAPGERRFAYDEVRAVFGHELAHDLPGTYSSSRVLAIPYRFSCLFLHVVFWTSCMLGSAPVTVIVLPLFLLLWQRSRSNRNLHEFSIVMRVIASIALTVVAEVEPLLTIVLLAFTLVRPTSAMFLQRRTEHWCDMVAVRSGADTSALARILQRFEPERRRYSRPGLWERLNSSHPSLHTRIVDLDHGSARER